MSDHAVHPVAAWIKGLAVYLEPKVLAILFLGFSAGLPLGLTGGTLSVWMKEEGVDLATIGVFALVGLPYVFKFLWAPAIDAVRLPWLTDRFGRRRGWLLLTQALLMAAIVVLGSADPVKMPALTALFAVLVAFCSASQDIVVDAFRIESLDKSRSGHGMANYVAGYRVATLVATAGAFEIASVLQAGAFPGGAGWSVTYALMAACVLVGVVTVLACAEPDAVARAPGSFSNAFAEAVTGPFLEFIRRPQWLAILLFVMLFKFGDAFAGIMTAPFVLDIGFDKTDYGRVVKLWGLAALLVGGFAGGLLYRAIGEVRSLWLAGVLMAASNLVFVWQAEMGAELWALVVTITVENFTGGLGTVIFVAYISGLCTDRRYTATQFALLSGLAAVGRTVLSASSGWFAVHLGWAAFFALSAGAALPGLALLWWLTRRAPRT